VPGEQEIEVLEGTPEIPALLEGEEKRAARTVDDVDDGLQALVFRVASPGMADQSRIPDRDHTRLRHRSMLLRGFFAPNPDVISLVDVRSGDLPRQAGRRLLEARISVI